MATRARAPGDEHDSRASSTGGLFSSARGLPPWLPGRHRHDLRRQLAVLPPFAGCSVGEVRRIVRRGELIEVDAGATLLRESSPDYWFYVVVTGSVELTREGRTVATLHRGGHVGEVAILAWGLASETAVAAERSIVFVLGRRDLLTFVHGVPAFRRVLFPAADRDGFDVVRRRLFQEGRQAWARLSREDWRPAGVLPESLKPLRLPGRSVRASSLSVLAARVLRDPSAEGAARQPFAAPKISRRVQIAALAAALVTFAASALLYRPPVAVVRAAATVDVAGDITVHDRTVFRPRGRYVLVAARFDRPSLAGTVAARIAGHDWVRLGPAADEGEQARGLDAFVTGERLAVTVAAAQTGLDAARLSVAFRQRDLSGPSAGLVYALALIDLLGDEDLAAGRIIAATGELDDQGRVWPVGLVDAKAEAAKAAGATVFLVPAGQERQARASGAEVHGVSSVAEAVELLKRP